MGNKTWHMIGGVIDTRPDPYEEFEERIEEHAAMVREHYHLPDPDGARLLPVDEMDEVPYSETVDLPDDNDVVDLEAARIRREFRDDHPEPKDCKRVCRYAWDTGTWPEHRCDPVCIYEEQGL